MFDFSYSLDPQEFIWSLHQRIQSKQEIFCVVNSRAVDGEWGPEAEIE